MLCTYAGDARASGLADPPAYSVQVRNLYPAAGLKSAGRWAYVGMGGWQCGKSEPTWHFHEVPYGELH